jgi:LysR family cys regulon transcriptional activator
MGVGIVASIAYEAERDTDLRALDAGSLFGINWTKLAVRRGSYLRGYVFAFIESFAPTLNRALVEKTLSDEPGTESYDI